MSDLLLFSYAILPKSKFVPKKFKYNSLLHPKFSLTGLSTLETYSGYLLYLTEMIDRVIILGCHTFGKQNPADSELMATYIHKLGVPKSKIVVCADGTNTFYQVEQAKTVIGGSTSHVRATTLKYHKKRTSVMLRAYGITAEMISVEELLLNNKRGRVPKDLLVLLRTFIGSNVEKSLKMEANLLLLLQFFDPKGFLQRVITNVRGVRYFDIDIPSRIV